MTPDRKDMSEKNQAPSSLAQSAGPGGTGRTLFLASVALLALGVVMVHSAMASVASPGPWYARVDIRHTIFAGFSLLLLMVLWRLDYRLLDVGRGFPFLAGALLLVSLVGGVLVFVEPIGYAKGGQYRWIRIGPPRYSIGLQPSELIKFSLIAFLAAWLTRPGRDVRSFLRTFVPATGLVLLCVALVVTQDFGTAFLIGLSSMVVLVLVGVPIAYLLSLLPIAGGGLMLMKWLQPEQWQMRWSRISAMIDPWSRSNPSAFQARQSLMAVLNGGWFGRGPGNGLRKLGYLPEDSTDFIFAVYCEEWGFAGAMLLIGLLLIWIWCARRVALRAPDAFGRVLAGSLGFAIALQMVLHVAVDLVAAPPTGMGLPFVSAGGTALVLLSCATSVIVSVAARCRPEASASAKPEAVLAGAR
jgi:cell division protein FtsW